MSKSLIVETTSNLEHLGFTPPELEAVQALVKHGKYSAAARELKMKPDALRALAYRLRKRYIRAKTFTKQMEYYRKRLGPGKKYLESGASKL